MESGNTPLTLLVRLLLAKLRLDSLMDEKSPVDIKNALGKLPKESDALNIAYDEAIERINSQQLGIENWLQEFYLGLPPPRDRQLS
jgi:hypothetical protein